MINTIPVSKMFADLVVPLDLTWVAGEEGGDKQLIGDTVQKPSLALVGHLNFVHPNRVQVLGCAEMDYLRQLGDAELAQAIDNLFATELAVVIIANGESVPAPLLVAARRTHTPLFTSPQASPELMAVLSHYLTHALADSINVHGVMLEVDGIGVMLTGNSAAGKSELALELITRGHRLVADDVVDLYKVAPAILEAQCPPMLQDFLEVRGLGVLNIRTLFGEPAVKFKKNLKLIVNLQDQTGMPQERISRLDMEATAETILGVEISKVYIPVAAGRNLAVLVEVATRNYILRARGINSAEDFIARQQRFLQANQ
ncbi:HPr(Ser) kinase/phosphatase [Sulfuriferula nivalis]|uniref:HPr kinase/phosphorylase n=1 Tax=Sulfuriferula nivalis TaxID=2675298 RepID=A0A809SIP2_9PROT|nr:HPr(Ser) kinase/phosphatase [Sulfuriferula nivalis]BBP02230.1 HPr kinase/phosphorylase [Sulfuriferula nivalis]